MPTLLKPSTEFDGDSPSAELSRSKPRHVVRYGWLLALGLAAVVWRGSDRIPADATRPLALEGAAVEATLPDGPFVIAAWNIHSGKGDDGKADLARTAAELEGVDFAVLNEVRCGFSRDANQSELLGRTLGMAWLFAPTERRWWHDHFGNAVLSKAELGPVHRVPLPSTADRGFRNALLTSFRYQDQTVRVLAVHVDRKQDRERQLGAVIDLFLSLREPAVLLGDLNTTADDPQLESLLSTPGVNDALRFALRDDLPNDHIDWIITRGLRTVSAEYRATAASDHPVVTATLELDLQHSVR